MAHGLPVVVSRAAGISDLLEHGVSAWLLDAGTGGEAAAALAALVRDDSLRLRLGQAGRAVAARRTWDDVARETLAVYRTLPAP
jgi:glycosyltransferase involved in cell wall biosynthesis